MHPFIIWHLPVEAANEANSSEHWTKKHKRHTNQHKWVKYEFWKNKVTLLDDSKVKIKMIRVSPRKFDQDDNLPMSLKYIKDKIADCLIPGKPMGVTDSDPRIVWEYDQISSKVAQQQLNFKFVRGVIVEFYDLSCEQTHNEL